MNTKHIDDMDLRRRIKRAARKYRRGNWTKRDLRSLAKHYPKFPRSGWHLPGAEA